ncbi:MAG: VanZ family protein [Gemmatimonas sp.]
MTEARRTLWWQRVLLTGALLFIAIATLTPGRAGTAPGIRPSFTCLACGSEGGADVSLNIALFLPLGVALALIGKSPIRALVIGAGVSMLVEFAQRTGFPPGRVANVTDLLTNSAGTLVGALIAWHRAWWMRPTPRAARVLVAGGLITIAAFLSLIGWSLGRDAAMDSMRPLMPSALRFTALYGWYHGVTSRVTINDRTFMHAGDGPVMLYGVPPRETVGEVSVTGRDDRADLVPMLYVHAHMPFVPEILLGQHGPHAELQVRLRGSRLRLPGPRLQLERVFTDTTAFITRVLRFGASPTQWQLEATGHGVDASSSLQASLPISLSLGWTLFQTVVHVGDLTGTVVNVTWMWVLWLPIGYWCALAGVSDAPDERWRWHFVCGGVFALVTLLIAIPRAAQISPTLAWEWLVSAGGLATGVLFARLSRISKQ